MNYEVRNPLGFWTFFMKKIFLLSSLRAYRHRQGGITKQFEIATPHYIKLSITTIKDNPQLNNPITINQSSSHSLP